MNAESSILVLEDDPEWVGIFRKILRERYDIVSAGNLAEAREQLADREFDLAIVDLNLRDGIDDSDRSGFELAEEIRQSPELRDMRIVIVSRYDSDDELRKAFRGLKVHEFLSKKHFPKKKFRDIITEAIAASLEEAQ